MPTGTISKIRARDPEKNTDKAALTADGTGIDRRRDGDFVDRDFGKIYDRIMGERLTEDDVKKIQEEIEYRKLVVRKQELEAVKEARAQGDLSENFEYKVAKQDKNKNESRIRYLERLLKNATIITDDSKEDEIGLDNTVTLFFEDEGDEETYRIVTSIRGNSLAGLISTESPLGKALMGHKVGDRVLVETDAGTGYYVVVRRIEKTTDESKDSIRQY